MIGTLVSLKDVAFDLLCCSWSFNDTQKAKFQNLYSTVTRKLALSSYLYSYIGALKLVDQFLSIF